MTTRTLYYVFDIEYVVIVFGAGQVDLIGSNDTRAMTAAVMVDRLLEPENFILILNENDFGPVNAVVSSV